MTKTGTGFGSGRAQRLTCTKRRLACAETSTHELYRPLPCAGQQNGRMLSRRPDVDRFGSGRAQRLTCTKRRLACAATSR
jgi:hypothetical protein